MSASLPAPSVGGLLTQWAWQPLAVVAALLLAGWYARSAHRLISAGGTWPLRRWLVFGVGLALFVWTTCGFLQVYVDSMYWVWTTQTLVLWLLIPGVLLAGQPLPLVLATSGPESWAARFLRSRIARVLGNPLVGPALVPVLSVVLFFGPLPAWAISVPGLGWALHLALVFVGALILLPLLGPDAHSSALAVALTLAIGSFELVLDAIPGIVLRLHRTLVSSYFDHRVLHPWSAGHLQDQQRAGAILWVVAELIDLPFLLLVFRRWLQADERDAAAVDAVLEAERAARGGMGAGDVDAEGTATADAPWWLSDPAMQRRLRGQG